MLTSIPIEDIRVIDEEIRNPSKSTRGRLTKNLSVEFDQLTPVPVATLFDSAVYASPSTRSPTLVEEVDPMIADAYSDEPLP